MVEVVALTACRGHDGGIRDGGAMVAAYSTCKACGHADDEKLGAGLEDGCDDRDKDTERTPRGTCCECKNTCNEEDDCGKKCAECLSLAVHDIADDVLCAETGGHFLKTGCKGKDKDRGNHGDEALRDALHGLLEGNYAADNEVCNDNNECDETAPRKTDGCIGFGECGNDIGTVKDTADVNETEYTGTDENGDYLEITMYAYMMLDDVTYTVKGTGVTETYNLYSYHAYATSTGNVNLVAVVEALMNYSVSAKAYRDAVIGN